MDDSIHIEVKVVDVVAICAESFADALVNRRILVSEPAEELWNAIKFYPLA